MHIGQVQSPIRYAKQMEAFSLNAKKGSVGRDKICLQNRKRILKSHYDAPRFKFDDKVESMAASCPGKAGGKQVWKLKRNSK